MVFSKYSWAPPADFNEILPNTRAGITDENFVTLITSRDFCYNMAGDTPMAIHTSTFMENFWRFILKNFPIRFKDPNFHNRFAGHE